MCQPSWLGEPKDGKVYVVRLSHWHAVICGSDGVRGNRNVSLSNSVGRCVLIYVLAIFVLLRAWIRLDSGISRRQ
jgi:hypothetical protein